MSNDKAAATWGHHDSAVQKPTRKHDTGRAIDINLRTTQYSEPLGAKQENVAYIWLMFFGVIGAHYFYLGRPGKALSYIFTLGYIGIGPLTDIFRLRGIVERANGKRVEA